MPTKDVTLKVRTDTSQAEKGFRNLESSTTKLTSNLRNIASSFGVAFGGMQIISFLKESSQLAMIQEAAEKRLQVAYGKSTEALKAYASELQSQTAYGDEAIIEAQALIAAFTKDEEAIKRLTAATLDLAAAKGMDLVTAADLLSKTIGSSTNALSRYGIVVEGAVGSTERLDSLVGNLNKKFGGQATAQLETYAGKIKALSNWWGDVKEKIGDVVNETLLLGVATMLSNSGITGMGAIAAQLQMADAVNKAFAQVRAEFNKTNEDVNESVKEESNRVGLLTFLYGDYIEVLRKAQAERIKMGIEGFGQKTGRINLSGVPFELSQKPIPIKPEIMIDESELRESFREFDVIANESARTLFNAFSQAWNDIFGEANSLFEQLLQNISMGLFDLFAQDVSKSIFESLIPGGGLLSGLGDALGLGKRSSVLVQIGESQVQTATAKVVPNAIAEQQRRRILD